MDCSAAVFMDEVSNFSTFSVVLLMLGCPEHSSPLTDIQLALKHE
jgi:nicotinate-nucleotide pyrophosphorylase